MWSCAAILMPDAWSPASLIWRQSGSPPWSILTPLFPGLARDQDQNSLFRGKPNLEAREDIKITDTSPIVRTVDGEPAAGDLLQRRLRWPGQNGKPVYNFRSDRRELALGRCLIPADGFYEFTDPADKKKKRKDKWLFTKSGEPGSASPTSGGRIRTSARRSPC
jgi:hypothetical protein